MSKDPTIFIGHMLDSIRLIQKYASAYDQQEFNRMQWLQDAIMRRLEIMGEAVKNITPEFRDNYPDIPWRRIAGLRDVLIHDYFGVDLDLTWSIVQNELPELKKQLSKIKRDLHPPKRR